MRKEGVVWWGYIRGKGRGGRGGGTLLFDGLASLAAPSTPAPVAAAFGFRCSDSFASSEGGWGRVVGVWQGRGGEGTSEGGWCGCGCGWCGCGWGRGGYIRG